VGDISFPIAQSLTVVRNLNIVVDQVHPFMATDALLVMAITSRIMRHAMLLVKVWFEEPLLMPWPPS